MNECIYYNVDAIHSAIANNRMIQFQYFQWNTKKKMEMRHNGQFYKISPWALTWEEVNVNVAISSQFFGWVFALGTGVKILAPENVVERMKQEIDALHDFYNK